MSGWNNHTGMAVCLPQENIDTDQIIPARFMSQPRIDGYEDFLFHDISRDQNGSSKSDFPLNRHSTTSILICGNNFGSGSSREAAAYALYDAGIRVVLATSFGDIFSANAVNNGLLPGIMDSIAWKKLSKLISDEALQCQINLETKTVIAADAEFSFDIEESWRTKLINGWDDIDLTLQHESRISTFEQGRKQLHPWAWPQTP